VCDFLNGPFAWPSAEDASVVFYELAEKGYMDKETSRYAVVSWCATAPTNVISTKPVRKLEDLKGLKFRTAASLAHYPMSGFSSRAFFSSSFSSLLSNFVLLYHF
jgi:TRAP-type C4-dicarboxylate transport system substrate-binding protein